MRFDNNFKTPINIFLSRHDINELILAEYRAPVYDETYRQKKRVFFKKSPYNAVIKRF